MTDNAVEQSKSDVPPVDQGQAPLPPMDASAQPPGGGAASAVGGTNDFAEMSQQYVKELAELGEGLRQRAMTVSADAPAVIQSVQQQIEPKARELVDAVADTQGAATAHPRAVIQTFMWSAIMLMASSLAAPLGTNILGPFVGIFLGKAGAALYAYIGIPAAAYCLVRAPVSDAKARFMMLGLFAAQGIIVGFVLAYSYLVSCPISALTPLIVAVAYPPILGALGGSKLNTTCAVVGAAVGVNLLLGLLAGFNSFPYFLLSLLYGGVAFAVLQLLHKFGTTPDAQTHVYQLATVASIVLAHGLVHMLFGSAAPPQKR